MQNLEKITRDYMTSIEKLITLPPDSSIEEARKILVSGKTTCIFIPPPRNGTIWRIFTSSDLVNALAQHIDSNKTKIEEFCSLATITAKPNWSLQFTLDKMAENGVHHMPIYENDQLIGMISSQDISGYLMEGITLKSTELKRNIRVFLCHSTNDKTRVEYYYDLLVKDGVDAWLDKKNLHAGQKWRIEIQKAIKNSHVVIVFLSSQSITKEGFVQSEIKIALDLADEKPEGTIFIIPAKLEPCEVPERLTELHWVNLFEKDGYENLFRALQLRANKL
jgi:CBS domain-containing protein